MEDKKDNLGIEGVPENYVVFSDSSDSTTDKKIKLNMIDEYLAGKTFKVFKDSTITPEDMNNGVKQDASSATAATTEERIEHIMSAAKKIFGANSKIFEVPPTSTTSLSGDDGKTFNFQESETGTLNLNGITEAYRNADPETKKKIENILEQIYWSSFKHVVEKEHQMVVDDVWFGRNKTQDFIDKIIPYDESWLYVGQEEIVLNAAQLGRADAITEIDISERYWKGIGGK